MRKYARDVDIDYKTYRQLYSVWTNMMSRCYDNSNKDYRSYGRKGVSVHLEWHNIETFIRESIFLQGWDVEKFISREICLDKDKFSQKETCVWITRDENLYLAKDTVQTRQRKFEAIRLSDGKIFTSNNQSQFSRENGLTRTKINDVLMGRSLSHKGWMFNFI